MKTLLEQYNEEKQEVRERFTGYEWLNADEAVAKVEFYLNEGMAFFSIDDLVDFVFEQMKNKKTSRVAEAMGKAIESGNYEYDFRKNLH